MKMIPATVKYNLQRSIGNTSCGVITKPKSQINFFKNTEKLRIVRVSFLGDREASLNGRVSFLDDRLNLLDDREGLLDDRLSLLDDCLSLLDDRLSLLDDRLSLLDDRLSLLDDRLSLLDDRLSLIGDRLDLNHFLAFLHHLILITLCYFTKYKIVNTKLYNKIKYSIYNNKGIHFNLYFINYFQFKVLFLIFKILFNKKHQYWCESDYFS